MTVTATATLDEARKWLGWTEGPNNSTPFGERWGFPGGAWCAMFFQSMTEDAGGTVGTDGTVPHSEWCPDGVAAYKSRGDWFAHPAVGDQVFFHHPDAYPQWFHTGVVEDVSEWPAAVTTIEGNTGTDEGINPAGGGVWRRRRVPGRYGYTFGFGRPRYDTAKPQLPPEVIMAGKAFFMQGKGDGRIFLVPETLACKWYVGSPTIADDVAFILQATGGGIIKPPAGVPTGAVGSNGHPVWTEMRPETLAAIPG